MNKKGTHELKRKQERKVMRSLDNAGQERRKASIALRVKKTEGNQKLAAKFNKEGTSDGRE